ncbi:hypothetical protein JAAARDRAFT_347616 [Jaapia argillacea MUCL 33604]|uniref:Acyl-CoA thioesterase II domain-containing protein n=1 Tax=Jaapia argillacea MUCL 33604 TaxID=933084 RepID=A0A067PLP3_9AGAM|nr:hypothetical protein JAAARDRAFT_347616 [Jaapia argillacea MUCL 33604]
MDDQGQAEHEQISTSLEVEKLDTTLFRSKSLWLPIRGRGVFGGQVISQAVVSATNCVDPGFGLHSLHCYFLLSASPAIPILYHVEKLREGRSYTTRSVKAVQNGRVVFILLCSFQRPEPWQPSHQWPMPANVTPPEQCILEETRYEKLASTEDMKPKLRTVFLEYADERRRSPVAVKAVPDPGRTSADFPSVHMWWMKAKNIPKYEAPFQKAILGYMSDLHFIGVAATTLGLKRMSKGPDALAMMSTLDHSIYYYNDSFDCGDWLLYVILSPTAGEGRGVVHGRMYTRSGKLVAIMTQEGVVRADRRDPQKEQMKSKL